jgi:heme-degrading monooxygenase HmoA
MSADGIAGSVGVGCWAVIFTSQRTAVDEGYDHASEEMVRLASSQPGFLGLESVRGADGFGITVSYWRDEASIRAWREKAEHRAVQRVGRERWYRAYRVRVARVEREYGLGLEPAERRDARVSP